MIMTAELNSHQRVSYYTGVKLIRHHHHNNSSQNPNNTNNTSAPISSNSNTPQNSASPGVFYHQHPNRYPIHPSTPHHIQHHGHKQQHPQPPLPQHHPGHFQQCPTGPPRIQHPAGMVHVNGHHGLPHNQHHPNHHHFGGSGSNQATRLYAGSPLIRSSGYYSSSGGSGVIGNNKRGSKHHHQKSQNHYPNNFGHGRHGVVNYHNQSIIHHQNGSCSSGTSSSSSSNEHLNHLQSPTGSPIAQAKINVATLKLPSQLNGEHSPGSSNNSSPCPMAGFMDSNSPSSGSTFSSTSSSPSSTDGNKDLDHFYFLDDHWKPSNDDGSATLRIATSDMVDFNGALHKNVMWNSASGESPSPPVSSVNQTNFTMMVDQFFAHGNNNDSVAGYGFADANNNFIGLTGDGDRDQNNNIIGGQSSLNVGQPNDGSPFGNIGGHRENGRDNQDRFPYIRSNPGNLATVVNVETQIGTFNGQRDLEIRLCFIKGDRHNSSQNGSLFRQNQTKQQISAKIPESECIKTVATVGDPFKSTPSLSPSEDQTKMLLRNGESDSSASSEQDRL